MLRLTILTETDLDELSTLIDNIHERTDIDPDVTSDIVKMCDIIGIEKPEEIEA